MKLTTMLAKRSGSFSLEHGVHLEGLNSVERSNVIYNSVNCKQYWL